MPGGTTTTDFYTLDAEGCPVPCHDTHAWARWHETAQRHVARTTYGEITISTVFLGLDHNFTGSGPPVLWETMVFGGMLDNEMERYTNLGDARRGHDAMVLRVVTAEGDGLPLVMLTAQEMER